MTILNWWICPKDLKLSTPVKRVWGYILGLPKYPKICSKSPLTLYCPNFCFRICHEKIGMYNYWWGKVNNGNLSQMGVDEHRTFLNLREVWRLNISGQHCYILKKSRVTLENLRLYFCSIKTNFHRINMAINYSI